MAGHDHGIGVDLRHDMCCRLHHHVPGQRHGGRRGRSVQRACGVRGADDERELRDGDVHSGVGFDLPGRHDDGDLHDDGRTELLVHGDGARHSGAFDHVSGEHHGAEHGWPVLGGSELHDADRDGQLSGRDGELCAGIRIDVPGGNDDRDVHGKRRVAGQPGRHVHVHCDDSRQ